MRIRYLVNFEKKGRLKYIGHLDLLRLMHRCVKLSGLPVDYSKGFNPHQLVSLALPLSVGMEGLSEYAVFEMKVQTACGQIMDSLNAVMPRGLRCIRVRDMDETEKNPSGLICAAWFSVKAGYLNWLDVVLREITESKNIYIQKPVKNGKNAKPNEETDIRPLIYGLTQTGENSFDMILAQGSARNLKPELVLMYMCSQTGEEYKIHKTAYVRKELYKTANGGGFEVLFS